MTHDELRDVLNYTAQDGMADEPILLAIRAVVELHRPLLHKHYGDDTQYVSCQGCGELYPCPTIQAIEKELR